MGHHELIETWNSFVPGPVQKINSFGSDHFYIKRLDLIQSWADGNKYYKIKNSIRFALDNRIETIVSKGGMFSNHLFSLAHACTQFKIELVCIVRSYKADHQNPMLSELEPITKEIVLLDAAVYNRFNEDDAEEKYPGSLFIPEGGLSEFALNGISEIWNECLEHHPTHLVISGGSMASACGLISVLPEDINLIIVPAWKGCSEEYVEDILKQYTLKSNGKWTIWKDTHFGGFAHYDRTLIDFMYRFTSNTGIPLDPVYTGKMMYGIVDKINSGYFSSKDKIIAIHTGGLQGIRGFAYRYPTDWSEYEKLISTI
ncbi:MAG: pyridoxal-phosphate dependent enzyme [Saprospiraceae bacterium]